MHTVGEAILDQVLNSPGWELSASLWPSFNLPTRQAESDLQFAEEETEGQSG